MKTSELQTRGKARTIMSASAEIRQRAPRLDRSIINDTVFDTTPLKQALLEVWRQALVENADVVELGSEPYPVRRTRKRQLRQVDFIFDGNEMRGLEQNPETKSRWAQMA